MGVFEWLILSDIQNMPKMQLNCAHGRAFSLIEILIVVAIIGILAAIVMPAFQDHIQRAKEAAAKDNLRILREAIERYAIRNDDIAPGYPGNNIAAPPLQIEFYLDMLREDYLSGKPKNPFNNLDTILIIKNNQAFPGSPSGNYGWIYQPLTKTIKLDWPGNDSEGQPYYDY